MIEDKTMNTQFVTMLAWIFGIASSFLLLARIIGAATYDEIDEMHDALRGIRRTFPVLYPAVTAIICWTWIITA